MMYPIGSMAVPGESKLCGIEFDLSRKYTLFLQQCQERISKFISRGDKVSEKNIQ